MSDLIDRAELIERLKRHKDFYVDAYGGFCNLPEKEKARVDELTNCIAEVVNAPAARCGECIHRQKRAMIEAISYAIFYVSLFAFLIYALLRL